MMKVSLLYVLTACFLIFSCTNPEGSSSPAAEPTAITVSIVSDGSNGVSPGGSARGVDIFDAADPQYFRDDLKPEIRGTLVGDFTPDEFVLDLDAILLYRMTGDSYSSANILEFITQPDGSIIPRHINMIQNDDFIRDFEVPSSRWDGIGINFLDDVSSSNDNHYVMSFMAVDLGDAYKGVKLPGEKDMEYWAFPRSLDFSANENYHYFELRTLNPYAAFVQHILVGSDIDSFGIANPGGNLDLSDDLPGFRSTAVILSPAQEELDFSCYSNPEVRFFWDCTNIIQVYDRGTEDLSDDLVCLNLEKPYPVGLSIEENDLSTRDDNAADTDPPAEVLYAAISGATTYNTIQWLNPNDEDLRRVIIVRKEGSEPENPDDGETVYESHIPNYCDDSGASGTLYYYRIFTEDYSGNISQGIVLSQEQP